MIIMRPFTFLLLQLFQRADDALAREHARVRPDPLRVIRLKYQRNRLKQRLQRSLVAVPALFSMMLAPMMLAEG
jgi:hypothetical protein